MGIFGAITGADRRQKRKGWRKAAGFLPPIVPHEQKAAWQEIKRRFQLDPSACPQCADQGRSGRLLLAGDQLRRCDNPACGFEIALVGPTADPDHRDEYVPEQRAGAFSRQSQAYLIFAAAILVASSLYSAYHITIWPLLGSLLVIIPIAAAAFALKYRAWQIANRRLHEERAPIGDFWREELTTLFSRGGGDRAA